MKMEIAIRGFMPLTTLYPKAVPAVEKFYTCGFSPEYQIIRITQTQQRVANNKQFDLKEFRKCFRPCFGEKKHINGPIHCIDVYEQEYSFNVRSFPSFEA